MGMKFFGLWLFGPILAFALANPSLAGTEINVADVFTFDNESVDGTATLIRTDSGVSYTLSTRSLQEDGAYTNWWVNFNDPKKCETPCACGSDADFEDPDLIAAIGIGVFYATGRVVDEWGQADFAANIAYGALPDGDDQVPFGPGFDNPIEPGAEIHLVVRTHGKPVRGRLEEQLNSFGGACDVRDCEDVQFAVNPSPTCGPKP